MKQQSNELDKAPFIHVLLNSQPKLLKAFESVLELKIKNFLSKLQTRNSNEQNIFILEEVKKVRETLENDSFNNIYNILCLSCEELAKMKLNVGNDIVKHFDSLLDKNKFPNELNVNEINSLAKLYELGINSEALKTIENSKNQENAFLSVLALFHTETKFLAFLIDKSKEFEDNSIDKLQWQGTQKELAELFLELVRKGWLKEVNPKLIKLHFTKSNTIDQVLKPTQNLRTKEKEYNELYKKNYTPKFEAIKQNMAKENK